MAKQLKDILESFDFNRAALAKQKLQNVRHLGRRVRGARIANLMRAAGLREEEMDETDLDQLDEVLSADAKAEDWIHDFVHSTNPKFEGKSKKERIKMALGAYYAKARHKDGEGLGEETEQIDELNKDTLKSYIKKAKPELNAAKAERSSARMAGDWKTQGEAGDTVNKRTAGIKAAKANLNKEEVEQIDELSGSTRRSYLKKAKIQLNNIEVVRSQGDKNAHAEKARRRVAALDKIANKPQQAKVVADALRKVTAPFKEETDLEEGVNKSDVPAYLRKKTGDKLTTQDLDKERTQNRSHPETIKKINGTVQEGLGSAISSVFQKMKSKLKPSTQPTSAPVAPTKPVQSIKPSKPKINPKLSAAAPKDAAHGRALLQKYGTKLSSATKAGHDSGDGHSYGDHVNPTTGDKSRFRLTSQGKYQHHDADSNTWNDLEHKDDISVARSAVLGAHKKAAADRPVAAWNHKRSVSEEFINLDESVKTTHEDPLVTVHDKHGLHTHANLSTANHIFATSVKHSDVHAGPVKTKDGHETKRDLTFAISKHHEIEMKKNQVQEAKNDDVPFDPPYKTVQGDGSVKDKSGAVHTPMSRARDLARKALQNQKQQKVDEAQYAGLEKEDKPGKVKTAVVKLHKQGVESETVEGWKDEKKPVKESYDEEGNLITMSKSFKEFMEGMTATQVRPGVTRYTGGSYGSAKGAKYGNTDYDKETLDTKDDEGSEEQKRGRGRPAGSKSGARGPRIK
mgnify:FL=1